MVNSITTARNTTIAQAVTEGRITQAEANQLKAANGGRGVGRGLFGTGADQAAALARALGITVEVLQTAKI